MDSLGWEIFNFAFWFGTLGTVGYFWRTRRIGGRFVATMFFLGIVLCVVDFLTYEARGGWSIVLAWWPVALFAFRGPRNTAPAGPPEVGPASRAFQPRSHPSVPRQ